MIKYSITCDHCGFECGLSDNEKDARALKPHIEFMHHFHAHGNILPEKFTFNLNEDDQETK